MLLAPDARTMNKGDGWAGCMIICEAGRGRLRLTMRTVALEAGGPPLALTRAAASQPHSKVSVTAAWR